MSACGHCRAHANGSHREQSVIDEGQLIAGHYRLLERIGSGSMGVVWRARDERLERVVAIKQLLPQPGLSEGQKQDARRRALREARIAARLHHPNAIVVFDVAEHDSDPCLVMEYLEANSMAALLADRGIMAAADVAAVGSQIASALAAAHASGIVHRDVKPANILINNAGVAKITDFGIARASGDVQVTQTGMFAGTPAYLAPEVARGKEPTSASDVFSFGATLYDAVEGGPPFPERQNQLALLRLVAEGKVQPPRQAGVLTALLMQLLRSDPDERPTMAQASRMLADLSVVKGPQPLSPGGRAAATLPDLKRPEAPAKVSGASAPTAVVQADARPEAKPAPTPAHPMPAQPVPARPVPAQPRPAQPMVTQPAVAQAAPPQSATMATPMVLSDRPAAYRPTTSSISPERRQAQRRRVILAAVIVVVVLVAVVVVVLLNSGGSGNSGGKGSSGGAAGAPTSVTHQTTTSPPASTATGTTTPSAPAVPAGSATSTGSIDWASAGQLIVQFYGEPGAHWADMTPGAQAVYGGEAAYQAYWAGFSEVSGNHAQGVAANADGSVTVPIDVTYTTGTGATKSTHTVHKDLRVVQEGRLLIDDPNTK